LKLLTLFTLLGVGLKDGLRFLLSPGLSPPASFLCTRGNQNRTVAIADSLQWRDRIDRGDRVDLVDNTISLVNAVPPVNQVPPVNPMCKQNGLHSPPEEPVWIIPLLRLIGVQAAGPAALGGRVAGDHTQLGQPKRAGRAVPDLEPGPGFGAGIGLDQEGELLPSRVRHEALIVEQRTPILRVLQCQRYSVGRQTLRLGSQPDAIPLPGPDRYVVLGQHDAPAVAPSGFGRRFTADDLQHRAWAVRVTGYQLPSDLQRVGCDLPMFGLAIVPR
jgi:hypothetical protein